MNLFSKFERGNPDECWPWQGYVNAAGYGLFHLTSQRRQNAHRAVYEALVGPIPEGLVLDHLCRVRNCVNPAHLEPVTNHENLMRGDTIPARNAAKTHCPQGHPYVEANIRYRMQLGSATRRCRACGKEEKRRAKQRARQARLTPTTPPVEETSR